MYEKTYTFTRKRILSISHCFFILIQVHRINANITLLNVHGMKYVHIYIHAFGIGP